MARSRLSSFAPPATALVLAALAALVPRPSPALWSGDPASPLVIADGASEQVQPKVVPLPDGGCYVSWFDNAAGGYDVRLQRLSARGEELWAHNGVLVADRGYSSTEDYGLAVDGSGNALLAFRDDSQATERIVAAKIDPDGVHLWGTPGLAVSDSTGSLHSPRIAATSDGEVVVGWTQDSDVILQRLDADGVEQWTHGGIALAHSGDFFLLADLRPTDAGSVIASWVRYVTFLGDKHLWAQKLDPTGAPLWASGHVKVFDPAGGSLQFGNFPGFGPDGAGGAVFAWYTATPALQVRAQHVTAAGSESFAHDGVELSTDTSRVRADPSATYDPASGDLYAFWVEANSLQSQFGLYGQRLDASGARQWGATGQVIVALGAPQVSQVRALPAAPGAAGAIVAWATAVAFDDQPVRAARLAAAGSFLWNPAIRDVKSAATGTSRLAAATSSDGFSIFAWTDGETPRDLVAQDLNGNGTLGPPLLFADGFESEDTSAWSSTTP